MRLVLTVLLTLLMGPPAFADWHKWASEGFEVQENDLEPDADNVVLKIIYGQLAGQYDWILDGKLYALYEDNVEEEIGSVGWKGQVSLYGGRGFLSSGKDEQNVGHHDLLYREYKYYPSPYMVSRRIKALRMKITWSYNNDHDETREFISGWKTVNTHIPNQPAGKLYRPAPGKIAFKVDGVKVYRGRYNRYFLFETSGRYYNSYHDYVCDLNENSSCDKVLIENADNAASKTLWVTYGTSYYHSGRGTTDFVQRIGSIDIPGCAYATDLSATTDQWATSNNVTLNWRTVTSGRDTNGKWGIYRKQKGGSWSLRREVPISTSSYTETIDTETDYIYRVGFIHNDWGTVSTPVKDVSTRELNVNLTRTYNIRLSVKGEPTKIIVKYAYPAGKGNAVFDLYRSTNNGQTWVKKYSAPKTLTDVEGTDSWEDNDVTSSCQSNLYKVETTVLGKKFTSNLMSGHITGETEVENLTVSKGTYANTVKLAWRVNQVGSDPTQYVVERRLLGSTADEDYKSIYSVEGTNASYVYDDNTAAPGQYYQYRLTAYKNCGSGAGRKLVALSTHEEDGFCVNTGSISGRIAYGTGTAVPDAKVILTSNSEAKNQFYSMRLYGKEAAIKWPMTKEQATNFFRKGQDDRPFTMQMWVRPKELKSSTVFHARGVCDLTLGHQQGGQHKGEYQLYVYSRKKKGEASTTVFYTGIYIKPDEFSHISLSSDGKRLTLRVTTDGSFQRYTTSDLEPVNLDNIDGSVVFGGMVDPSSGYSFDGYIDEIRVWDKELSDKEILNTYNRIISGTEQNLKLYWPLDENIPNQSTAYDYSKSSDVPNGNHGKIRGARGTSQEISTVVPTPDQLSVYGITDTNGGYLITGVPFASGGTSYSITPSKGSHQFNPQSLTRFVNSEALNHSAVNFEDISSFKVGGKVTFANTTYPVDSCYFYVDGTICSKDGKPVMSDAEGNYEISVPIGDHYIEVRKDGHVFCNKGRFPADPGGVGTYKTFTEEVKNLSFQDSTLVTIAGRVAGGKLEMGKPLGMGLSKNNIGRAKIILSVNGYLLNAVRKQGPGASVTTEANSSDVWIERPTKDVGSSAYRLGGDVDRAKQIRIDTDSKTGEFAALVPPIMYKVESIEILNNSAVKFENLGNIDARAVRQVKTDSTTVDGKKKEFKYVAALKVPYRVAPTLEVTDKRYKNRAFGEQTFKYDDGNGGKEDVTLFTADGNNVNYVFGSPIFKQLSQYTFKVKGYERYVNKDHGTSWVYDDVPLQGVTVKFANQMGTGQQVAIKDFSANGKNYKTGDLGETPQDVVKLDSLGNAEYRWSAGFPNIIAPYTRDISATYEVDNRTYQWEGLNGQKKLTGVVLGVLPSGNNFVTEGPDKVAMILRDPAGTNSYAYWEKGQSTTHTQTTSVTAQTSLNQKITATAGMVFESVSGLGFAVVSKVEATVGGSAGVEMNYERVNSNTTEVTTSATKRVSTSGAEDFVGAAGDVFIGSSTNVLFGNCRKVFLEKKDGQFAINNGDGITTGEKFMTDFAYHQNYIEETLIPNLETLRNALLTTVSDAEYANYVNNTNKVKYITRLKADDERFGKSNDDKVWGEKAVPFNSIEGPSYKVVYPKTANATAGTFYVDKVHYYNEQIRNWQQILANNEKAKVEAIRNSSKYHKLNQSFSAGSSVESSVTNTNKETRSYSSTFRMTGTSTLKLTAKFNDIGIESETTFQNSVEKGSSHENSKERSVTMGYVLAENGDDDALSVDIYNAPDGFGPIFRTRGGQTSCPYEGQIVTKYYEPGTEISAATMQIEQPHISCAQPVATDVASGSKATFPLVLSNTSETKESLYFRLSVVDQTNKNSAKLSLPIGNLSGNRTVLVPAGETVKMNLYLTQSNTDVYDYDSIAVVLSSQCQSDPTGVHDVIADTVWISAHFVPSSSPITLKSDMNLMNTSTGTNLALKMRDFDAKFKNLKYIELQYKGESDANWRRAKRYVIDPKDKDGDSELLPEGGIVNVTFSMDNSAVYPDQKYFFRAITAAGYGNEVVTNESETLTVIKDMNRPKPLGNPMPSDGLFNPGSELSLTFNENVLSSELTKETNFDVTAALNGSDVIFDTALKLEGNGKVASTETDINLAGKSFAADMWIKLNKPGGTLLQHGNADNKFGVAMDSEGHLVVSIGTQKYTSSKVMPLNRWAYLTLSYQVNDDKNLLYATVAYDATTAHLFAAEKVVAYSGNGRLSVGGGADGSIKELVLWDGERTINEGLADKFVTKKPTTTGILGYWKMDEGMGRVANDCARSRNMALSNEAWYLNNINKAVRLDGNSYLLMNIAECPAMEADDYAVELWFRGEKQSDNATLFSLNENALRVSFTQAGALQLTSKDETTALGKDSYLDNNWHHFALNVQRAGYASVYVDGALIKSMPAKKVAAFAADAAIIAGTRYLNNTGQWAYRNFFKGSVDEIRFWNATLSANLIKERMRTMVSAKAEGLKAYYPFEEVTVNLGTGQKEVIGSFKDMSLTKAKAMTGSSTVEFIDQAPALKTVPQEQNLAYSFVASDNKIVISLDEDADKLEGTTVHITVKNVHDINGNLSSPVTWSAFIHQNTLVWTDNAVTIQQKEGKHTGFTVAFTNSGSATENWKLVSLPSWLKVDADYGQLTPQSSKTIRFSTKESTPIGKYEATVYLKGNNNIYTPLTVSLNVTGEQPSWSVNPVDYESSMNLIGTLSVQGVPSNDENDMVAAFVNDTVCVGVAKPTYLSKYDAYFLLMTIYGNAEPKDITFKAYNASTGRVYPVINENPAVSYRANTLAGSFTSPVALNALDYVERALTLNKGWNWKSVNVKMPSTALADVFHTVGKQIANIKYNNNFARANEQGMFVGDLLNIDYKHTYLINARENCEQYVIGGILDPTKVSIDMTTGWNWISYIPQTTMSVNEALAGIAAHDMDIIKSQSKFAVYTGTDWQGSLKYMSPIEGYAYFNAGSQGFSFNYPKTSSVLGIGHAPMKQYGASVWKNDSYTAFPYNMTIIAKVMKNNVPVANSEIAVFSNDDNCRSDEFTDADGRAYLTVSGGDKAEVMTVKIYEAATQRVHTLPNIFTYNRDRMMGTYAQPFTIDLGVTGIDHVLTTGFHSIDVYDISGVLYRHVEQTDGVSVLNSMEHGTYIFVINTGNGRLIKKIVK